MNRNSKLGTICKVAACAASTYGVLATLRRWEERTANAGVGRGRRFVVLGGGFAGAAVAQELARLLPGRDNGEILLIDEDNYLLFTPMLTEAAGGELETGHIVSPLRDLEPRVRFVQGRIKGIDLEAKSVQVESGFGSVDPAAQDFQADHLVIALGSVTNFHNTPGAAENSIAMKTLEDARRVFAKASACLERAATEPDAAKRKELLTFVVGGGGYTGVETMAAVNDFLRSSAEALPGVAADEIRTVIVQPGDRLLPELSPELASYATAKLRERGVDVRLNTSIVSVTDRSVELNGGETIAARTLIWAAGVTPNPLIEQLATAKGKHHGIVADGCCRVPDHGGVWALGDCAEIPEPAAKGTYAPTAQNATREGRLVARNIVRSLRGEAPKPFRYKPMGELALVGRHSGVARVYGHNFSGPVAWAMWRAVYLAKMPSPAQRVRLIGDWLLDAIFGRVPAPLTAAPQPAGETHS